MQAQLPPGCKWDQADYDAYIDALVKAMPPLTEEQRNRLRQLLEPSDAGAALVSARWAKSTSTGRRAATAKARAALAAKVRAAKAAQESGGFGDAA